jgi:hypothetical protein
MTREFELSEQLHSRPTRRTVVATGVKLAYAAPIVAASFKVSTVNAQVGVSPVTPPCGHSTGPNGGCMGACTSRGFTGQQCGIICGTGQSTGACPVGQGDDNPCCDPGYCIPTNFVDANNDGVPEYIGPTCPAAAAAGKKKKKK